MVSGRADRLYQVECLQPATRAASSVVAAAAAAVVALTRGTSPTKHSVPADSHLSPIVR